MTRQTTSPPPLPSGTSPKPTPLGYKRSPSVTASIDFFESRSKPSSAANSPGPSRSSSISGPSRQTNIGRITRSTTSPQLSGPASVSSSPRPSFSSLADGRTGGMSRSSSFASMNSEAGPSRAGSPRTTPSRAGSAAGRGVPPSGVPSRLPRSVSARDGISGKGKEVDSGISSGRASADSTASGRASVGLGVQGVSGIPRPTTGSGSRSASGQGAQGGTGTRRVSDTSAHPATTSLRPRQPRPSLPTSSLTTSISGRQPSVPGSSQQNSTAGPSKSTSRGSPRVPSSTQASSSSRGHPASTTSPRTHPSPRIGSSKFPSSTSQAHSPRRPSAPVVSVSHPTPDRDKPLPSATARMPREDGDTASSQGSHASGSTGLGSRRTSYRLSRSINSHSSSSNSSGRISPNHTIDISSAVDLSISDTTTHLRGHKRRSTVDLASPPMRAPLEIPQRRSSAASSANPSPRSSISQFPPVISPRKSSIEAFGQSPEHPDVLERDVPRRSHRRASSNIQLGNVYEDSTPQGRQVVSPRLDRKSPGLTIDPPAPAFMQSASSSARPSPPIPAKSPLRSLSRQSSMSRKGSMSSRLTSRDSTAGTNDSTTAVVGYYDMDDPVPPLPTNLQRHNSDRRTSSSTVVVRDEEVELTPQTRYIDTMDDPKRFTTLTYASMYSQDSAPGTATFSEEAGSSVPNSAVEDPYDGIERERMDKRVKRQSRMDDLWGRSHAGRSGPGRSPDLTLETLRLEVPQSSGLNLMTDSPDTASTTVTVSTTTSDVSRQAVSGHTPLALMTPTERPVPQIPTRSPSEPMLNGAPAPRAAKLLGIQGSPGRPTYRGQTVPAPLLPSAMTRSPTAPVISPRAATTPNSGVSKRTHLIREIAQTERAYATDLALIRDAYLSRYLRPPSTVSSGNDSSTAISSRRGSIPTADKRLSGTDWPANAAPSAFSPPIRSPGEYASGPYGYFTPSSSASFAPTAATATTSVSSLKHSQVSPGDASRSSMIMPPPVGKPLSPADVRAVFLNIDQLATGAEEMAVAFEKAMGQEEGGPGVTSKAGEGGSDKLGEVFTTLIPRLRPIYLYYCSRQHNASTRLVELLSDSSTAAHLNECWSMIKSQTHAWNLDSMLIKPIQRITKYPLLFEDLLSCTTPVHPDYFNIRSAAELAKTIAIEIDEAKRRKDVVASALGTKKTPKTPKSTLPSPAKESLSSSSSKKGLKMFRKEKSSPGSSTPSFPLSISTSTLLSDSSPPPEITKTSFGLMGDYIARLEESDQVVRRVGKEVVLWTAGAKEVMVAQRGLMDTWAKVLVLDQQTGNGDARIEALKVVLEGVVADAWANLNEEVRERIMPIFAKLLESSSNPRRVISKRESKHADYTRYFTLVKARKTADRTLLLSARDFYALHIQLIDELPIFLEGYSRIFDLALVAFAEAQARYFEGCKLRLAEFAQRWVARPRKSPTINLSSPRPENTQGGVLGGSRENGIEEGLGAGRGIVKAWYDAWAPYAEAMEHFQCTRPARAVASRIASFNTRPGSRTPSRPTSRVSSPGPMAPSLQHSASFTGRYPSGSTNGDRSSTHSRSTSASTSSRARSTSLLGPMAPPLVSPSQEKSRFNLLRVGSSSSKLPKPQQPPQRPSRPTSLHVPSSGPMENRYSFGLPKIPDSAFDGLSRLGIPSPQPPNRMLPPRSPAAKRDTPLGSASSGGSTGGSANRATSDPTNHVDFLGGKYGMKTGLEEDDSPTINQQRREKVGRTNSAQSGVGEGSRLSVNYGAEAMTMRRKSSARDIGDQYARPTAGVGNDNAGLGLGDVQPRQLSGTHNQAGTRVTSPKKGRPFPLPPPVTSGQVGQRDANGPRRVSEVSRASRESRGDVGVDASEGWRDEPVLYQCGCVAEFDPNEVGNKRYRGLRFLSMAHGDLFDIFHEVGRIDELPKFPYPEIGVDNDGVLVGRGEDGSIGLLICSFLEPLRE